MVLLSLKLNRLILSPRSIYKNYRNCRYMFIACKLNASTIDEREIKKFDSKNDWWEGKYSLLHSLNSLRIPLIRDGILSQAKSYGKNPNPLKGYHILDVGCGGGILSEPLARLGANVTGIDLGSQSIEAATKHAAQDPEISNRVNYACDSIENLAVSDVRYDAVVASEVIEHVNDIQTFVHCCVQLTKNNGSIFFTTFNRTGLSYFMTILMAEYALQLIPKGTHEWNKFVLPEDLSRILESMNCRIVSVEGIFFNPITRKFSWCKSIANWYALHAVKE